MRPHKNGERGTQRHFSPDFENCIVSISATFRLEEATGIYARKLAFGGCEKHKMPNRPDGYGLIAMNFERDNDTPAQPQPRKGSRNGGSPARTAGR